MMTNLDGIDGVYRVRAPNASAYTGAGTNSYLIASKDGHCAVIDPGPDDGDHLSRLASLAAELGRLDAILITHGHPDHDEGALALQELTRAPVYASRLADRVIPNRPLDDGDSLMLGERTLVAITTPGHRFDHLSYLLGDIGVLFAGDLVSGDGTVLIAPPEGDLAEYLASISRLMSLNICHLLPGHGPPPADPQALLTQYLDHRMGRERQILDLLAAGPLRIDEMLPGIYPALDPALREAARLTLLAHLLKLEREARVTRMETTEGSSRWPILGVSAAPI